MNKEIETKIESILSGCVRGAIKRTAQNASFRPFHEALLTKELVSASAFERSFSTSFGQGPIEEISALVAEGNGFEVKRQKETMVNVFKGAIDEIDRIISGLRDGERRPDWENEVKKVTSHAKGDTEVRRVISDLWMRKGNHEIFFSIKTVKPNLDQTQIAKKDMLMLKAHNPEFEVYLGLFYNPGGPDRSDYNWTMPMKIFDMHRDTCVLIGEDYWNRLGGSDTYTDLLRIFARVGEQTRELLLGRN